MSVKMKHLKLIGCMWGRSRRPKIVRSLIKKCEGTAWSRWPRWKRTRGLWQRKSKRRLQSIVGTDSRGPAQRWTFSFLLLDSIVNISFGLPLHIVLFKVVIPATRLRRRKSSIPHDEEIQDAMNKFYQMWTIYAQTVTGTQKRNSKLSQN